MKKSVLVFITLLIICSISRSNAEYMRVHYIQYVKEGARAKFGDCVYYEFPGKDGILDTTDDRNLLFDAGAAPDESDFSWPLYKFLDNKIGQEGILWFVMLSHAHYDHYSGLKKVLDRYNVKYYYEGCDASFYRKVNNYYSAVFKPAVIEEVGEENVYYVEPGDYLSGPRTNKGPGWDPYIKARVLASVDKDTGNLNDNSVILKISCGKSTFLQGGDATGDEEDDSPAYYAIHHYPEEFPVDVWKIQHHGSNTHGSNSKEFLAVCRPKYAINLTGYGTPTHPNVHTLERIRNYGARIYRVDLDGNVCVRCDHKGNYDFDRARVYVDETETPGGAGAWQYPPPDLPGGLRVVGRTKHSVRLSWDANLSIITDKDKYRYDIFRSSCPGGDPGAGRSIKPGMEEPTGIYRRIKSGVKNTTWTDRTCKEGNWYFYRISVWDITSHYERRYSNEVSTRTLGRDRIPPGVIMDLSALSGTTPGTINLSWTAPGNDGEFGGIANGQWEIAYTTVSKVQCPKSYIIISTSCSPMTDHRLPITGLTPAATYYFSLRTVDGAGNRSDFSNLACVWTGMGEEILQKRLNIWRIVLIVSLIFLIILLAVRYGGKRIF